MNDREEGQTAPPMFLAFCFWLKNLILLLNIRGRMCGAALWTLAQGLCCCVMSAELSEQDRLDWGQKFNREQLRHNHIYFPAKWKLLCLTSTWRSPRLQNPKLFISISINLQMRKANRVQWKIIGEQKRTIPQQMDKWEDLNRDGWLNRERDTFCCWCMSVCVCGRAGWLTIPSFKVKHFTKAKWIIGVWTFSSPFL